MAVMGLGITGRAVADALLRRSIDVIALDDRPSEEVQAWARQRDLAVLRPDDVDLASVLADADALLPAPGLPDHHRAFAVAQATNTPVMSEFDLAAQWDRRPAVSVTATDGKTTVVTLIERMLNASGMQAQAVGNTDTPWVEAIDDPTTDVFVVEASSFRLGHSQHFQPHVGAWLNFGPDHLDAHRDLDAYETAKASIWAHMGPDHLAVANRQDPVVVAHANRASDRGVPLQTFGLDTPPTANDYGIAGDMLVGADEALIAVGDLKRSLPHDIANGLAAAACARAIGATNEAVIEVLRAFDGLEHRVQFVAEIDGVRYINDSKATTPHAAAAALGGFDSIVLLAGGKNKGLAFDDMVAHQHRIRHVVAIGDSAADIEAVFAATTPTTTADSMIAAVEEAQRIAQPGDVVLLSPACASYDWYRSYVHRGHDFMNIVRQLRPRAGQPEVCS